MQFRNSTHASRNGPNIAPQVAMAKEKDHDLFGSSDMGFISHVIGSISEMSASGMRNNAVRERWLGRFASKVDKEDCSYGLRWSCSKGRNCKGDTTEKKCNNKHQHTHRKTKSLIYLPQLKQLFETFPLQWLKVFGEVLVLFTYI